MPSNSNQSSQKVFEIWQIFFYSSEHAIFLFESPTTVSLFALSKVVFFSQQTGRRTGVLLITKARTPSANPVHPAWRQRWPRPHHSTARRSSPCTRTASSFWHRTGMIDTPACPTTRNRWVSWQLRYSWLPDWLTDWVTLHLVYRLPFGLYSHFIPSALHILTATLNRWVTSTWSASLLPALMDETESIQFWV